MMSIPTEVVAALSAYAAGEKPIRDVERAAVKSVLAVLVQKAPGNSVELRVPPFAAVQIVEGPRHRRGTPSAVVELDAQTLLKLATAELDWNQAKRIGKISASGERSDISELFPIWVLSTPSAN